MPTQWAHEFYWDVSSTVVEVIPEAKGGYPAWQSAPLGMLGVAWGVPLDRLVAWMKRLWWAICAAWRWSGYPVERRRVLFRVERAMQDPYWTLGLKAVHETANTLGFNNPEAWVAYGREIKSDPGRAQNIFRHQRAMGLLRDSLKADYGSTLTNPDQNLIIELAYHGWATRQDPAT